MSTITLDNGSVFSINGYSVRIIHFPGAKWGAEWIGADGRKVIIFHKTKTKLLNKIDGCMRLRKDI